MACTCQQNASALAGLGELSDWFLPSLVAKKANQYVSAQRDAAVRGVGASIQQAAHRAVREGGPWILGAATILAAGAVGYAWVSTRGKKGRRRR